MTAPTVARPGPLSVDHAFVVAVERRERHVDVAVVGELDAWTAPVLEAHLADLARGGHHRLVVDLTATSFLDAAGMEVLLAADRRCRLAGGSVVLHGPTPFTHRMLQVTGLVDVFEVVPAGLDLPPPAPPPAASRP